MTKVLSLVLFSVISLNAVAETTAPKFCLFWGYLNEIVYRYEAKCSDGKAYFQDSFLGPLFSSKRAALKVKVLKRMERDGLYPVTTIGGYEVLTPKGSSFDPAKNSLCIVYKSTAKFQCSLNPTLTVNGSGSDTPEQTLQKNGYAKVYDYNAVVLLVK